MGKRKSSQIRIIKIVGLLFILYNAFVFNHAYRFTHFYGQIKTSDPKKIGLSEKTKIIFAGIGNPRPENTILPKKPYVKVAINGNLATKCWHIKVPNAKGTVILFHGYGGNKSDLLGQSAIFNKMGYNCLLADFMGSGESEGNATTIGFYEARQVVDCYNYVKKTEKHPIVLYGNSMGAAAIMRALAIYKIKPQKVVL